jgi:hypothetical protein
MADLESQILEFLKQNTGRSFRPSDIALGVGIQKPNNTAKSVNHHLYSLMRKNMVVKHCEPNGASPLWEFNSY